MEKKKLILSVILPVIVSLLIIALDWIVCVDRLFHRAHLFMIHGILELFVTFLFPAAPVIYGWITKNRLGSILVGAIPIMGFLLLLNFGYFYPSPDLERIIRVVAYGVCLSTVAGLEGYFASKTIIPIAILLGVLWFFIFLVGID
jgi:hypothetical protein